MKVKNTHIPLKYAFLTAMIFCGNISYAQSISFQDAEKQLLQNSYNTQAFQQLTEASNLSAEAVKNLGLPQIDLNVRAISYHTRVDVPLETLKNNLSQGLVDNVNNKIDQLPGLDPNVANDLKGLSQQGISEGVGLIPNSYDMTLKDHMVRPTISMIMPIYTGGLTTSTKQIAQISKQQGQLTQQQQQDLQLFELIQTYFNVQLQKQLLSSSQYNKKAMQTHYDNALKLEKQGFISKGQRLQFEVALNTAKRIEQSTNAGLQSSLFHLNNMLHDSQITQLSTPLFVNTDTQLSLNSLLKSFNQQSTLIKKLEADSLLAAENVKIKNAAQKPKIFAFGEYALDEKDNWIVGIAAQYNLFSGVNKHKSIRAAELEHSATKLLTEQAKKELENIIYKSFSELTTAQQSNTLIQSNFVAAEENLRIQTLSFKEDMGTATQVIDAQNLIYALKTESALNAYKYVMSLASLLQSNGSLQNFQSFIHQPNTHYIK